MPMVDYQTAAVTDVSGIITEIQQFAADNGWTVDGDIIHDGVDCYNEIVSHEGGLRIRGGRGIDGGELTDASWRWSYWRDWELLGVQFDANGTLHLFAHDDPDAIFAILQYQGDCYHWLTFGNIVKQASFNGGTWFSATEGHDDDDPEVNQDHVDSDGATAEHPGALMVPTKNEGGSGSVFRQRTNGTLF
ncbi:MAG: hypothetical protein ACODAB_10075, partial [Gemmatimonadota bacterium]